MGAQGGRRIAAARSHLRATARLVAWVLVGGLVAGLARAAAPMLARMRGSMPWSRGEERRVCPLLRSIGAMVRRGSRPLADAYCSRSDHSYRRYEALESLLAGGLATPASYGCALTAQLAAFPEIRRLGYFARMVEEFDALGGGGDWPGPDATSRTRSRRGRTARRRRGCANGSRQSWVTLTIRPSRQTSR